MEARFKTLQVMWGALMAGVLSYAVVAYCLVVFGGVVLSLAPRRALTFVGPVAVFGMVVGAMVQQSLGRAIPRDLDPTQRMARYASAVIVGLAVTEGCGLLVVTLGLLALDDPESVPGVMAEGRSEAEQLRFIEEIGRRMPLHAVALLEAIDHHHADKVIRKAARKELFRVRSRLASQRL